jgi:hypothetical protein
LVLQNLAEIASLIETCKLNGVDPQAYFADVLTRLVNLWPAYANRHRGRCRPSFPPGEQGVLAIEHDRCPGQS